jgi:hypothetical protein
MTKSFLDIEENLVKLTEHNHLMSFSNEQLKIIEEVFYWAMATLEDHYEILEEIFDKLNVEMKKRKLKKLRVVR